MAQSVLDEAAKVVLARPSPAQLKRVLLRFKHETGLGSDCANPRSWLLLGDSFLVRLLDFLELWESAPA
eukprot:3144105-Pyramimonas_sp.AAC.1